MEPSTDGGAELLIDDSTCGCCCCPWRRRKASGLRDPFLTAGEHCATGFVHLLLALGAQPGLSSA